MLLTQPASMFSRWSLFHILSNQATTEQPIAQSAIILTSRGCWHIITLGTAFIREPKQTGILKSAEKVNRSWQNDFCD